ncbi:hypothetical protein [Massilia varians]|uniref:hypothetical protein n=1 Tax=Massilia varians TaxID=457921 RepID=UPI002554CE06|nr:hypothetical protein [Massilia varians]MDK6080551.1 hypothetical protein [Massilia varians]
MNEDNLTEYRTALNRLKDGQPKIVPKGTKITRDAVSLEAGRGKGSIKKSRPVFSQLIAEIEAAAAEQSLPRRGVEQQSDRLKSEIKELRTQLDAALSREMSLVYELFEVKHALAKINNSKVIPIRGRNSATGDSGMHD